jgi:hypothetical protein
MPIILLFTGDSRLSDKLHAFFADDGYDHARRFHPHSAEWPNL